MSIKISLVDKILAHIIILTICGCNISNRENQPKPTSISGCPSQAPSLLPENTETIIMSNDSVEKALRLLEKQSKGYQFQGVAGQVLKIDNKEQNQENLCLWVYTPAGQTLEKVDSDFYIPLTGNYIIQIFTPEGSQAQTFFLNFSLENPASPSNESSLIGTWKGSYNINNSQSTLIVNQQSENSFRGVISTEGNTGGFYSLAIQGNINPNTNEITMQETKVISKPTSTSWFLGTNKGKITGDYQQISGEGKDSHGNEYIWNFSKKSEDITIEKSPVTNIDLVGTWEGKFINVPNSQLIIKTQSGNLFSGTLITKGNQEKIYHLAIEGEINPNTNEIIIREVAVLSKPSSGVWYLGINTGTLSSVQDQISGTGKDSKGNQYSWSFRRK